MLTVMLGLLGAAYTIGLLRLWKAAGFHHGVRGRQAAAFAAGWLTLVVALISPLDELSERLFSAHMVQHELLMIVAAPLIVVGSPLVVLAWLLPSRQRRRSFGMLRDRRIIAVWTLVAAPASAWLLHAVALWVWHLPVLFEAALHHEAVHALQHSSFFGSALLFWWGMSHGRYGRLGYGAAVIYVFATAAHSGVLGALLTFAPRVWYASYASGSGLGLNGLEDQQLGGLIMWVPAGVIYTGVGLAYFAAWLRESERRSRFTIVSRDAAGYSRSELRVSKTTSLLTAALAVSLSIVGWGCTNETYRDAAAMTGGDPAEGRETIPQYGCDTCHTIPGVATATGLVGPPLTRIASRVYLAGQLPNTPDNMEIWIRHPRGVEPRTVMPDVGVTDIDARNIAAYLYTLR